MFRRRRNRREIVLAFWQVPEVWLKQVGTEPAQTERLEDELFGRARRPGLVYSEIDGGWVHPDVREGNAFGRYEREQEAAAFFADPE